LKLSIESEKGVQNMHSQKNRVYLLKSKSGAKASVLHEASSREIRMNFSGSGLPLSLQNGERILDIAKSKASRVIGKRAAEISIRLNGQSDSYQGQVFNAAVAAQGTNLNIHVEKTAKYPLTALRMALSAISKQFRREKRAQESRRSRDGGDLKRNQIFAA
jgi:ribosome-associated translation inhibitor RaiA